VITEGGKIERPNEHKPSNVVDLMDALRQSVKSGGGERREPRSHPRAAKKAGRSSAVTRRPVDGLLFQQPNGLPGLTLVTIIGTLLLMSLLGWW
jgi:hypothetical protein